MKYKKGLANEARLSWARKRRKNSLPQMAEIDGQDERTDRGELGLNKNESRPSACAKVMVLASSQFNSMTFAACEI